MQNFGAPFFILEEGLPSSAWSVDAVLDFLDGPRLSEVEKDEE